MRKKRKAFKRGPFGGAGGSRALHGSGRPLGGGRVSRGFGLGSAPTSIAGLAETLGAIFRRPTRARVTGRGR